MAKFLRNDDITSELVKVIENAGSGRLLLISPYLKFSRRIRESLEDQVRTFKPDVRVVYGKHDLRPEQYDWLDENDIRTSYREHLHAKCYMNDSHALITSMNLYEFSQQNNDEMGILVSEEEDPDLYRDIKKGAERILRQSEKVKLQVTRVDDDDDVSPRGKLDEVPQREPASNRRQTALPEFGCCLRCGTQIPFAPDRPYCNSHYRSWAKFKNENYEEKHCHSCGTDHSASMAKPLCLSCFRKYGSALRAAG